MTDSREKGKRAERLLAELFRDNGYDARRGQQYSGDPSAPDVLVADLPWLHIECKHQERGNPWRYMEQCIEDSSSVQMPVVGMKRNRGRWLFVLTSEDFFRMLDRYQKGGWGGAEINPSQETPE